LSGPHLLYALDDHLVSLAQAGSDDHIDVAIRTGRDPALFHLVLVVDYEHVIAGLIDLQRGLWDHQTRLFLALANRDRHELAVNQLVPWVGNGRAHDQRVGLLIDLRIGEVPQAALRVVLAARQPDADLYFGQASVGLAPGGANQFKIAHAHRKQHVHGVLADDGREHAARRVDEIAHRVRRAPNATIDRRVNIGVSEIHLCLSERCFGLQNLGVRAVEVGFIFVDQRLRRELLLGKFEIAIVLQFGVGRFRLGRREICLSLFNQCLKLNLLDLVEQLAHLDVLSLAKQHLVKEPLDSRPDVYFVDRFNAADKFEGPTHAFQGREADPNRGGRRWRGRLFAFITTRRQQYQDQR